MLPKNLIYRIVMVDMYVLPQRRTIFKTTIFIVDPLNLQAYSTVFTSPFSFGAYQNFKRNN